MSREFPFDPALPLPSGCKPRSPNRFPFSLMLVGDSFIVPGRKDRMAAMHAAKRFREHNPGRIFTSVRQDDGTYRIWRAI